MRKEGALARSDASASGGGVDADIAELAVERRAADAEAARDFRHAAAIMADGETDDVRFDLFERAQVALVREQCNAARPAKGNVARLVGAKIRREVALARGETRLGRDMREVLGGQAAAVAMEAGA